MKKEDGLDRLRKSLADTDPERLRELRREEALKSALSATAKEDKERLVGVLRDWLRE